MCAAAHRVKRFWKSCSRGHHKTLLKRLICHTSALKCRKTTRRSLGRIFCRVVHLHYPNRFQQSVQTREICKFIQGNRAFHLIACQWRHFLFALWSQRGVITLRDTQDATYDTSDIEKGQAETSQLASPLITEDKSLTYRKTSAVDVHWE